MGDQADLTRPKVSVVIPVRDRRSLLAACLDGLARQGREIPFEVVVVDDGSTDGSGDAARARDGKGLTVRVIEGKAEGAVAARQVGVANALGDILAFTDSDCVPRPEWLAEGVRAIDDGADVAQGITVPARPVGPGERSVSVGVEDGLYATCNVFYRREAFDHAGGFDGGAARRLGFRLDNRARGLGFGEDTLVGWRVRRGGASAFVPEAVVEHHVFPASFAESVSRAAMAGAFPALVRDVPELRATLLTRRVLLGTGRVGLYLAVIGGVALRGRRGRVLAACGVGWWLASTARRVRRAGGGPREVAAEAVVDVVTGASLVAGSVRSRTIVL
jgi:glycosyltransferase involved in cell wall biosynthesis